MALTSRLEVEIDSRDAEQKAKDLRAALGELEASGNLIDPSLKKASKSMDGLGKSSKGATESIKGQADEVGDLLGRINPLIKKLDELDKQEQELVKHRKSGKIDTETYNEYQAKIASTRAELGRFNDSLNKTGISAKQNAAALRMLPAQFSDIAVSLQGGQAPLTVFLQQGSQIKDSFGGAGAAVKAFSGYMLGLINPLTVGAAAAGALGAVFYDAEKQVSAFNKSLFSGTASSGQTAASLAAISKAVSGITGDISEANAAVITLAGSAKLSQTQFVNLAQASASISEFSGKSAAEVAKSLGDVGDSATKAAEKISAQYGLLTSAQYEVIAALDEQGKKQEALDALSGFINENAQKRLAAYKASLSDIERDWNNIGTAISNAYSRVKAELFPDLSKEAELIERVIKTREEGGVLGSISSGFGKASTAFDSVLGLEDRDSTDAMKRRLALIKERIALGRQEAVIESEADKAERARIEAQSKWNADMKSGLTGQAKLEDEISKKRALGLAAGRSQVEIDKEVAALREKYEKSLPKPKAYAEDAGTKELDRAKEQYAVLMQQSSLIDQQGASTKVLGAAAKDLIEWEQQLANIKTKQTLTADQQSLLAKADQITAVKTQSAEQEKLNALKKEELETSAKLLAFQESINNQLDLSQEGLSNQLAGVGMGREAQKRLQDDLKIRQDYQKQLAKLQRDYQNIVNPTSAQTDLYDKETQVLEDALGQRLRMQEDYYTQLEKAQSDWTNGANAAWQDYVYEAGDIAGQTYDLFDNAFRGMEDSLVDFVTGGKLSFKDLADSIIADIARIIIKTQVVTPLLNSLFGGGAGAGGGGGVASLFSGSSSNGSGGGGLFSGLAGLGQNLLSAWNTITGVGSSVASGYASGGIGGAISGGASYYGNMLSNIASTLSGGFTSLIGGNIAITGATAAGTAATTAALTGVTAAQAAAAAATVGAEGITAAALQGAIAEGAASIGTNIGVAGATTAAASQGIAASISGALSSAAAMWPLAVIMGMYQSGKLYDAGVRPSMSEMQATGGDTALGKATMAPIALQSGIMELTDKINSKLVGGKLAAIISGSTLHQAVWGAVGKKLFGGAWETKDGGISLGVDDGELDAKQYIYQKKKGGLFSSSKKRTRYSALDAETEDALGSAYNEKILNSMGLFSALGVQLSETVLDGLNVAASKISTKGKTPEAIQEELDKWFSGLGDSAVSAINAATNSGLENYNFEALTTFVNNLYSVNDSFDMLGLKLYDVSVSTGFMAEQLIAMAGGLEALKAGESSFFENFYTDTEKADYALSTVNKQFEAMGVKLPGTRDAYRDMVEALDLTTESGRQMYVTLTGLSGSAAQSFSILEQRATEAQQKAAEAAQAIIDSLMGAVTGASSAVQRAISAQQKATTEAYNARVTSLNDMVSTATENVSGLTSVGNDLGAALKALRGDSDDAVKMLRAQAQATLQSALATARSGGSLSGFTGLSDALDTVSNNNTDLYGSMEDFARDQGRTANVVAELNGINGKQLTTAEKSLAGLKEQIDLAKAAYDAQMAQFDSQLAFAQAQMDALNGVDTSVMGVTAAVNAMNAAVVAAIAAINGKSTPTNAGVLIDTIYKDVLGRDADAGGKQYWQDQLASGALNNGNIVGAITNAAAIEAAYKAAGVAMNDGASYWAGQLSSGALTAAQLQEAVRNAAIANGSISGYATGGLISGPGTGTSDSIIARLSNGEYVLTADAVRTYGTGMLDQMNAGQLPAFAGGGAIRLVGTSSSADVAGSSYVGSTKSAASMAVSRNEQGVIDAINALQNYLYMITKYSEQTASGVRRQNEMQEAA